MYNSPPIFLEPCQKVHVVRYAGLKERYTVSKPSVVVKTCDPTQAGFPLPAGEDMSANSFRFSTSGHRTLRLAFLPSTKRDGEVRMQGIFAAPSDCPDHPQLSNASEAAAEWLRTPQTAIHMTLTTTSMPRFSSPPAAPLSCL